MDLLSFDENQLKSLLLEKLSDDFVFNPEVRGINLVEQEIVVIDFLAMAKPHIVDSGFTDKWFGIEVKSVSSINQVCWQTLTYAQSVFNDERPPFVFMFLNDPYCTKHLIAFLQYGNVGLLRLNEDGYYMSFAGGTYFSKSSNITRKGKTNAGLNRYVGNVLGNKQKLKKVRQQKV